MLPTSSKRNSIARGIAAPSVLICVLCVALYWQVQRLVAAPRPSPEMYSGLALWLSILLASLCWWQLLSLSRAHAGVLEALQAQAQRLEEDVLDQAAEALQRYAIFMLDPRGYVASWDRAAERLLGYTTGDAMARHISLFYSDTDARQGKPAHDLAIAMTQGRSEDERWMVRKDGFRFKSSVAIIAIRDPAGSLCGFTNVIREETPESSD